MQLNNNYQSKSLIKPKLEQKGDQDSSGTSSSNSISNSNEFHITGRRRSYKEMIEDDTEPEYDIPGFTLDIFDNEIPGIACDLGENVESAFL